jgi:hypothetical protein
VAIAEVQTAFGLTGNPVLSGVLAGDSLFLLVPFITTNTVAGFPTISDSSGQTWNPDLIPNSVGASGDFVGAALFSLLNANAGTHTITVTITDLLGNQQWAMGEFSGINTTSALDQTGTVLSTATETSMTVTAGGANSLANELGFAIAAVETNSGTSAALTDPPTGFTSMGVNQTWQSSDFGWEAAYQIYTSVATASAAYSWSGAGNRNVALIGTYKAALAPITLMGQILT